MTLTQLFKNIADAIRNKKGTTGTIKATNFASEISSITLATGDANPEDVLNGKKFSKTGANGLEGSMPNKSGWSATVNANSQSVYIPKGYHNGSYKVNWSNTGTGTATKDNVSSNYTFTSENAGTKVQGTLIDSGFEPEAQSVGWLNGYIYLYHTADSNKWDQRRIVQSGMKVALDRLKNASLIGSTGAENVRAGQTFSSSTAGFNATGTLPYRGVAQEVTTYGSGDWGTGNPYFAINKIPQGIYASEGYEWGPEVRIRTKYLGSATAAQVLEGYSYTASDAVAGWGEIPSRESQDITLNPGDTHTYYWGYYAKSMSVRATGIIIDKKSQILTLGAEGHEWLYFTFDTSVIAITGIWKATGGDYGQFGQHQDVGLRANYWSGSPIWVSSNNNKQVILDIYNQCDTTSSCMWTIQVARYGS